MNQHIEQAIDNFRRSGVRYAKTERYYRGDHDLAFATEKFENAFGTLFREFAMNLCPAICDAVKDKLRSDGKQERLPCGQPFLLKRNRVWPNAAAAFHGSGGYRR